MNWNGEDEVPEIPQPHRVPLTLIERFMQLYAENEELEEEIEDTCRFAVNQNIQYMEASRMHDEHMNRVVHYREYKWRQRATGHEQLMGDYFKGEGSAFREDDFRSRYRMRQPLFEKILHDISAENVYFQQHPDALGVPGFTGHQKVTVALRMLAYGLPADATDEHLRIGQKTVCDTLKEFCLAIHHRYGHEYLRRPTAEDVTQLLTENEACGFPGMLGSIDCMHWEWRNCPTAWKGQYIEKNPKPIVVLEAVAVKHGWFWHANFGMPESLNDLNLFASSDLFNEVLAGTAPPCNYVMNGRSYDMGYYLGDGIYPQVATIIKAIKHCLPDSPEAYFTRYQESVRKDIERAFGMLQARFACIRQPCRFKEPHVLGHIMRACIILNNMIVHDERGRHLPPAVDYSLESDPGIRRSERMLHRPLHYDKVYNKVLHNQLEKDLVAHIWARNHGENNIPPA